LSYSNFGAVNSKTSKKMAKAATILHQTNPDLIVDGEVQADFALNRKMMRDKFPFSHLTGKKVNALIFPNLAAANISYKVMKELNNIESVGPIVMGLKKPVHLVQFQASVDEIVNMTTIAVVNAQEHENEA
jgi:malate dehydrogenase (oxaloacetate-decarboxylating)(NADP+)